MFFQRLGGRWEISQEVIEFKGSRKNGKLGKQPAIDGLDQFI
jgi:hypothetical protein